MVAKWFLRGGRVVSSRFLSGVSAVFRQRFNGVSTFFNKRGLACVLRVLMISV